MNWKARMQTWATLVAALALPLLYIGGTADIAALSVVGIILFAGSLSICPGLRFIRTKPARAAASSSTPSAEAKVAAR